MVLVVCRDLYPYVEQGQVCCFLSFLDRFGGEIGARSKNSTMKTLKVGCDANSKIYNLSPFAVLHLYIPTDFRVKKGTLDDFTFRNS